MKKDWRHFAVNDVVSRHGDDEQLIVSRSPSGDLIEVTCIKPDSTGAFAVGYTEWNVPWRYEFVREKETMNANHPVSMDVPGLPDAAKIMAHLAPAGVLLCPKCGGYGSHAIFSTKDGSFIAHRCPCGYDSEKETT